MWSFWQLSWHCRSSRPARFNSNLQYRVYTQCITIFSVLIPDRLAWSVGGGAAYQNDDFKQAKEILVKEFEVNFITQHLRQQNGNIAATARKIGVHPVFLRQKVANLGIDAKNIKDESAKA